MKNIFLCLALWMTTLSIVPSVSIAQKVEFRDSCPEWQLITAKDANANIVLMLSTNNDGQKYLVWSNPSKKDTRFEIHKAKGPINSEGQIEVCIIGLHVFFFYPDKDSYSLLDLFKNPKLDTGYYAVRLELGDFSGFTQTPFDYSNWIVIQKTEIFVLIAELKSEDWRVRYSSAQDLGNLKDAAREAVPALKIASQDSEPHVRQAALTALEKIVPNSFLEIAGAGLAAVLLTITLLLLIIRHKRRRRAGLSVKKVV
jgi:hypothetical protein